MDIQELLSKVGQNLSVSRSFGAAYEKDGAMIIPVAFVAGGGGGGEGTGPSPSSSSAESDQTRRLRRRIWGVVRAGDSVAS